MRFPLLSFLLLAVLAVAPSASAQAPGVVTALFDPVSGRFSSSLGDEPGRAPDTLTASAERVWSVLPSVYTELGVGLTVVDSAMRYLGAIRATTRRPVAGLRLARILECGTGNLGPNAERYTVQLTLVTGVRPIDSTHSTVVTRVVGNAAPNGLNSSVKCGSNGALEEKLLSVLRAHLAQ
jgi:hypothetical protein